MVVPFVGLLLGSIPLIPLAYCIAILDKIKVIRLCDEAEKKGLIIDLLLFVVFGLVFLLLDVVLGDVYYFWANVFRRDLQKCIIKKEQSHISYKSLKEIKNMALKQDSHKIETAHADQIVRNFRRKLKIKKNTQFLCYGQWVPEGGFVKIKKIKRMTTIVTQRTQDLTKAREEESRVTASDTTFLKVTEQLQ